MAVDTAIGTRVRKLRELHGMTQMELGEALGIGEAGVRELESERDDDVRVSTIRRLCEVFHEHPGILIFGEDDEHRDRTLGKKPSPNSSDKGTVPTKATEMMAAIGRAIESTLGRKGLSILHSVTALNETGLARASTLVDDLLKIRDYRSGK